MEWASVTLCSLIFSFRIQFFFYPNLLLLLYFAPKFIVNLNSKIWHHIKRPNFLSSHCLKNNKNKLYFTTQKYTLYYTLHPKFFECTICTINYDPYFTLHHNIKFAVNLDKKKWHHMKKPNCLSSQCLKK